MKDKTKKILFSVISGLTIIGTSLGLGLGFGLPKKDLDGISNTDTSSYTSIGEIWKSDKKVFNGENLNKLYKSITGNSSATIANIDSLASSTATAADIRANNGGKDIVVRLGGLDWQVMYLSKDSDGNAIATLWLSNNEQDAFAGRSSSEGAYYGYVSSAVTGKTGLYSDWSADWYANKTYDGETNFYPSAMYGTSYIRAVTLNNGGTYATSNTALTTALPNSSSIFAPFTMSTDGENNDLTDFIVKPSKVSWQKDQSSKTIQGTSYNYPNDAWNTATSDTGFYSAAYNYAEHSNYAQWANDYLWLPSIAETGYNATYTGLWKPSTNQRMNYNGSDTSITGVSIGTTANTSFTNEVCTYSWLRSGMYSGVYQPVSLLSVENPSIALYFVYHSLAVRPALHLNLDLAEECREPTLTLNLNGGKYNGSTATIKASNLKKGDNYSLPVPTREGYRFVGWVPTTNYEDASLSTLGKFDRSWSHNTDPFFQSYDFRLVRYSNINSSGSAVAQYLFRTEQPSHSPYNWQTFLLQNDNGLTNEGRLGGFSFCTKSYADAEFFIVFQAKIPREYQMIWATNQLGNNNYSQADSFNTVCYGTGEWQTYIVWIKCHPASVGGIYSDTNYFYFTGKEGTSTAPVEFFISYASVFDATGLSGNNNYENVKARMAKGGTYTVGSGDQTLVALWETDEWTDYADMSWEGSGTQASPYLISSAEELAGIAYSANFKQTSFSGKYFRQTKPIFLGGKEWIPMGCGIKNFGGIYDGGNFEITNLEMHNNDYTHAGLFGFCWGATIKNIILNNAYIVRTGDCVGGIVGYFETSTITNCSVQGFFKGNRWVGGIIGSGYAVNISHCSFSGTVEATGGLAGGITGQIKKESTISYCQNYGNVIGGYEYTGGLVGKVYQGTISNCISKGTIEGKRKVGSLVGHMSSDENGNPVLQNCSGYGYIIDNDKISAGGLVGQCDSATSVINCSFYGSCNMNSAPPFYNEANSVSSTTFSGCWVFINGKGYYSQGDFSGWTPMNNMNYGLPIQNSLYAVAIGGYSSAEVIASLQNKGFILYS